MAPSSKAYQSDRHTLGKIIKGHSMKSPDQVNRRNERERKRVQNLNNLYHTLAAKLSIYSPAKNKKFSKKETLRTAIEYIKYLEKILENDEEYDENNFLCLDSSSSLSVAHSPMDVNTSSSASSTHSSLENSFCYTQSCYEKIEPISPTQIQHGYDSSTNSSPNYPCSINSSYTCQQQSSQQQQQQQQLLQQQHQIQTYYDHIQPWKGNAYHQQPGSYYMATTM
jgi:hypothetical protein